MALLQQELELIQRLALQVRQQVLQANNNYLAGTCIKASEMLARALSANDFAASTHRVWCLYDNWESCTDYCYEEHWLVQFARHGQKYFLDVTLDQFQPYINEPIPQIYFDSKLPRYLLTKKPTKAFLEGIGWFEFLDYGG